METFLPSALSLNFLINRLVGAVYFLSGESIRCNSVEDFRMPNTLLLKHACNFDDCDAGYFHTCAFVHFPRSINSEDYRPEYICTGRILPRCWLCIDARSRVS